MTALMCLSFHKAAWLKCNVWIIEMFDPASFLETFAVSLHAGSF